MKIAIFSKKQLFLWVLVGVWLAIVLAVILFATVVKPVSAAKRRLPVYSVEHTEKKIALTFNCAWGDETTDAVLALLKKHNIRATFFFVGTFAEQYPESVENEELNSLVLTLRNQADEITALKKEVQTLRTNLTNSDEISETTKEAVKDAIEESKKAEEKKAPVKKAPAKKAAPKAKEGATKAPAKRTTGTKKTEEK